MLTNELNHTLSIRLDTSFEKLKQKIKKRLKTAEYKDYLTHKVGTEEFYKQIERIDNLIQVLDDTVTHRLPALEYEFNRDLKTKADKEEMKTALAGKVNNEIADKLIDRLNNQEESLASVHAQLKVLAEQAADSDNDKP